MPSGSLAARQGQDEEELVPVIGNMDNAEVLPVMKDFDFQKMLRAVDPVLQEFIELYDSKEDAVFPRIREIKDSLFAKG